MKKEYAERYDFWLSDPYFDEDAKKELAAIKDNEKEIEDRFYKELAFGTGGLRGKLGIGTNRMNIYTVRKATQGVADYINSRDDITGEKSVAIAYDSRNMSREFALETALCFNANGIKAYLFTDERSTPELSFTIRYFKATAGIVITASHNPAQYNGYKVYWSHAAQITPPQDSEIIGYVNAVTDYHAIKSMSKEDALAAGLLVLIDQEVDNAFIEGAKKVTFTDEDISQEKAAIKIVYTPLHGTGGMPVLRILNESGYQNVIPVREQLEPNGDFPTVEFPNPEEPSAFKLALELAKQENADIVLATDPDADRLGLYAKNSDGEYSSFNGNMIGSLLADYILTQLSNSGKIPENAVMVKTIVTTNMLRAITDSFNVKIEEVLTGFKYIGEKINEYERDGSYTYLFGMEESYGYLANAYVRDKDAVSSVVLICEMAAYYKKHGKNLCEVMEELYGKYGCFKEILSYIVLDGAEGAAKIQQIMANLRKSSPESIGSEPVLRFRDYLSLEETDIATGEKTPLALNQSDVVYFVLKDNGFVCVRPSGTEPKIKLYISVSDKDEPSALARIENIETEIKKLFI